MRRLVFMALMAAATVLPGTRVLAETPAEKAMAQQIGSRLKESGELRNYRIGVKYVDGVAWLSGSVTSDQQRDAAVRLTERITGVTHVVAKLDVQGQPAAITNGNRSQQMRGTFNDVALEPTGRGSSGVVQAMASTGPSSPALSRVPSQPQQQSMSPRTARKQQSMARNNMPRPSQRIPGGMPMPPNGGQGVNPASCSNCGPGGPMGGAGMGGPGMPGGGMMMGGEGGGAPMPTGVVPAGFGHGANYDNPQMPNYAWPSYASYPNYAALTYPTQYSPTAWPYIGPFYPYPQVPLAWRKVSLEWDDGWWFLDFSAHNSSH